jgi:hypothetical protein
LHGPVEFKEECSCPTSSPILLTSTTRSLSQGKTVELIAQPAAYSGAADDDLVAQRIADQEARIELIIKRREEVLKSTNSETRRRDMTKSRVKKNMEVIGADGVHIGTVDRIIAGRIRLTKNDSGKGRHKGHHHYIDLGLVADIGPDGEAVGGRGHRCYLRGGEIGGANLVNKLEMREVDYLKPEEREDVIQVYESLHKERLNRLAS